MSGGPPEVKALGEVALRVRDLEAMDAFYTEVLGLEVMERFPDAVFLRIGPGWGGHTTVLVLFDRAPDDATEDDGYRPPHPHRSSLDHVALTVPADDLPAWEKHLAVQGLEVERVRHTWVPWRSLYIEDPEGNQVELVAYDPTLDAA